MKRVLCVWLPEFPIQRIRCASRREQAPRSSSGAPAGTLSQSTAYVLYTESGNRAQIVTASAEATRHGVRSGMPLAEAQALIESAEFLPHDAEADTTELQSLAGLCDRYSPLVGIELSNDEHCLMLDISGCAHLFGGESGLARRLVIDLAEHGYSAHIAVANTIGAAWAIARYGHGTGSDRRLRSLPVEALRIPDKLASRLREFDLRTIGQLTALPKESLPSRFGPILTERLDQMFGRSDELLDLVPRSKPVSAEWTTDEPIRHRLAIRHVCTDLLTEILDTLKSRGEGLLRLTLSFSGDAGEPTLLEIGLAKPTDSLPHVLTLLQLKLESNAIPEWLHTIRAEASVTATQQTRQQGLFAHQEPESDNENVRRLIDRLSTRLGRDAVVRPQLLPEAVPEQAAGDLPLTESSDSSLDRSRARKSSGVRQKGPKPYGSGDLSSADFLPMIDPAIASSRPLLLLQQPEPTRVTSVMPDGDPECFYWNRSWHQVASCTRPERIATGWWQETGSVRRDYYQVTTQSGVRFWLFRDGNRNWFLHGVFE